MSQSTLQKITVSVPPEKLARMADAVESGESGAYSSQGEILREALDLWESQQDLIDRETAWLTSEHPSMGSPHPEYGKNARMLVEGNYKIIYVPSGNGILVTAIVHARRLPANWL